jgi:hypothetical protein
MTAAVVDRRAKAGASMIDRNYMPLLPLIGFGVWAHFAMDIFFPMRGDTALYLENVDGNVASLIAKADNIAEAVEKCVRRN